MPTDSKDILVAFYVNGPIFPIEMGSQRVIFEIAKFLHDLPGVRVRLIIQAHHDSKYESEYARIAHEFVWIRPVERRGFWTLLNSIVSRLNIDILRGWGLAKLIRKSMRAAVADADWVVTNYAVWGAALSSKIRREKTLVITHDLMFYRRASFGGTNTWLKRCTISFNKWIELSVLKGYRQVGVFADYERKILMDNGIEPCKVLKLGMPIEVKSKIHRTIDDSRPKYDFVMIGGNSYQNEQGIRVFFDRVVPLLGTRPCSLAVAGGVSNAEIWDHIEIPVTLRVDRLGYVDDLQDVYENSLIGLGTVPYGSGVKVKVVETIMSGLPMVLTNSGEEGIPTMPEGIINIDRLSSKEAKKRLLDWLDNPRQTKAKGIAEAEYVANRFTPQVALVELKNLLVEELCAS